MAIKNAAPQAREIISYNIPAYRLDGMLVYFAAYKNHIGFYPTSSGVREFKSQLSKYRVSKGAIQFPINEVLPVSLIKKIVKFRVKENREKAAMKERREKGAMKERREKGVLKENREKAAMKETRKKEAMTEKGGVAKGKGKTARRGR